MKRNEPNSQQIFDSIGRYKISILMLFFLIYFCTNIHSQDNSNLITNELQLYDLTLLNNGLFLIPPLLWNVIFASKLPSIYSEGTVPGPLLWTENILRFSTMIYPIFIPINTNNENFEIGLITYSIGIALYFTSWSIMMFSDNEKAKNSIFIKLAPAYTPLIWLLGISIMSDSTLYPILSTGFIGTHVGEYLYRFNILTIKY
jgi:hypothetical protein